MEFIRKDLLNLTYKGVPSPEEVAEEIGIPEEALVKLNANENSFGAPQVVRDAVARELSKAHIYPDPAQRKLRADLAKLHADALEHGIEQVVDGAGSDDILDVIIRLFSPKEIIICSFPTTGNPYLELAQNRKSLLGAHPQ